VLHSYIRQLAYGGSSVGFPEILRGGFFEILLESFGIPVVKKG
jgi:hypothetical protein